MRTGYIQLNNPGVENVCFSYDPVAEFRGSVITHEETFSIARALTVNDDRFYRPTVLFVYKPCEIAARYMAHARLSGYPEPKKTHVLYDEIVSGTEYVGIFLFGENFDPVWVGNRLELDYITKHNMSGAQTPTITPVAMGCLAAVCWMLNNKNKKGIFYPDDIAESEAIITQSEKYISKTLYATFKQSDIKHINFSNIQLKDFLN
jgi:homospermidine synthase